MEIIQELIGTRKKQQILNNEAKKTLHKQIKKVTNQREVSEPPPELKHGFNSNPHHHQTKPQDYNLREDSLGKYPVANQTAAQGHHKAAQQLSSQKPGKHLQTTTSGYATSTHQTQDNHDGHNESQKQSSARQVSSPKTQTTSKKPSNTQTQQHQISASAQKKLQDMRVRKVRSKSPPTNESGKNPAAKIKKFYKGMIPAFTNKKRQHAYYNTSKQGFTYINWDMENELYIFQNVIEQKFRKSAMNKNFTFPLKPESRQHNADSVEGQQPKTEQQPVRQRLSMTQTKTSANDVHGSSSKQHQSSRSKVAYNDTKKSNHSVEKQQQLGSGHQDEGDRQKPRLFNANQNPSSTSGELSARVQTNTASFTNQTIKTTVANTHESKHKSGHHTSQSAHKTPQGNIQLKAQSTSHPMSKSVLKSEKESSDAQGLNLQHQQYSHKKPEKSNREKLQTSSAHSLKLNQQKQLSAMIKQSGPSQAHSSLFSPQNVSRKNPKQMVQTTYVSMKGQGSSSKTYGLSTTTIQSSTVPTTPLPINSQNHMVTLNYQSSRDQSARSQRDLQQQQGQSEPLLKKATAYMARKNGQQHSVNQRMPKQAPAYCTTQFNNSVNSSQIPSRLTVQTSSDGKDLSLSAQKHMYNGGNTTDFANISQYTPTQRLNDSASGIHNSSSNNVIKFSSEYGTYNTVQIGDEMVNRSSDYGGGRADSTDRQSQKTNQMTLSSVVSPDIQIQSMEQDQQIGFVEPHRILSQRNKLENTTKIQPLRTYGGSTMDGFSSTKLTRSNQSSVQAMRNTTINNGQASNRLSPAAKKRNIRGQLSSQMNKTTTSQSDVKKLMMKTSQALNTTGQPKTKSFYKTMIKPGTISSQSFVQVPDNLVKTSSNLGGGHNRFNSQTPRTITSPENAVANMQKLQRTGEVKLEAQYSSRAQGMHVTPTQKLRGSPSKNQRQQSLNSKEMFQVSKYRTDSNMGPNVNQYTPNAVKMAPSKAFAASDSKFNKDSITPNTKQKTVRSRNNEAGKQTVDNNVHKSSKWVDEKHAKTLNRGLDKPSQKQSKNTNQSKHKVLKRRDTEECENFDVKDLDEREPCQTFQSHEFQSTCSNQKTSKVPLTTRSTHSLAINNLTKAMTQDLNLTSPGQHEEPVSNRSAKYGHQRQTQPHVKYRNEQMKFQGPLAQPLQMNTFQNLNPEYLSGDGSPKHHMGGTSVLHTANGSASTSDLGKRQTQTMKDFFLEDQYVIKEEKHKTNKKAGGHTVGGATGKQNSRTKNGQLNSIARDFTMQNYSNAKHGSTSKVLNLPPKPSRNTKNNTLVLGNSTGAPTRSMQSILLSKVKNINQQQTMQSTLVMTPKREQFVSNSLFKGYQPRKHDSSKQTMTANQAKSTSFKEPKQSQMRNFNRTAEKQNLNRGSIGDHGSPKSKRIDSAKKVNKVNSQELLKGGHGSQYSTGSAIQHHEKKGAKHLYMSLNKDKGNKSTSQRDKSVSSDNHYFKQTLTGGKIREKNAGGNQRKTKASNDYEIVFDHINDDSIPQDPSYDLEEQPTVVLVEEMLPHEIMDQNDNRNGGGIYKSKEKNASLLNSSALSRDHQISHPFSMSVEPVQPSGRNTMKESNKLQSELPKLGSADSKLFRQSVGVINQEGSSKATKNGMIGPQHEVTGFNKQLSKKQNALKMKHGSSNTLFMGQSTTMGHLTTTMTQPVLNKNQSMVSSQASLHQVSQQSVPHQGTTTTKQKLAKQGGSATTHAKMLQTYAKAMQDSSSHQHSQLERAARGGDPMHHQQNQSHKKTTKKSMIKQ